MSEHRRALDAVTGIPASAGFCEPGEGYADSPMSIAPTVKAMAYEVGRLNKQLADAKEENERVRQANLHTMDVFKDMKAAKEQAEARVAELEDALVWSLGKLSIEVPVSGGNVSYIQAFEKADSVLGRSSSEPWLLRKQAEAVEAATASHEIKSATDDSKCYSVALRDYAQRLRQQADELERQSVEGGSDGY